MLVTKYQVIVDGDATHHEHEFDGEPQINLTFTMEDGKVYRVTSRAHDEAADRPTIHAEVA